MSNVEVYTFIERSDYDKNETGNWQVKSVTLIDFPVGGKQAYLDWAAINAPTLIDRHEVKSIAAYDNYYGVTPHRLILVEFANIEDAEAWNALEVRKALDAELQNYTTNKVVHVFELIQRDTNER